ncbi:hypothetical protein G6L81_16080 [Agrobacterium rhizogenes]|nr:hypothetical protein [Rhizobium rhizogenes]
MVPSRCAACFDPFFRSCMACRLLLAA